MSDSGQSFPDVSAVYLHKVATKLHNYNGDLPAEFVNPLVNFIKATCSHVATLNYDKLLYSAFIENGIFNGYSGYLVDGMLDQGFSADALERKYGKNFGYYLHLHGSPLFVIRGASIVKLPRDELTDAFSEASQQIVLTHIKHKPSVIAASSVLSTYWDYLQFSLSEANEIFLFGYSGLDKHLNMLLKPYLGTKRLKVVEWDGAGNQKDREQYWQNILGQVVAVTRLPSIIEFTDWD